MASVQVRFGDSELIGRLISRASEDLQARINGPRWYVSQTNPKRLEAAMQAAANAKERAEAYASGVAAEVGQLMKLSDPELASAGGRPIRHSGVVFEAMVASGGDDMPIETGEHEIVAAIDATFALRPI